MTKKLEVSDLVFDYENRKILNHLDFSVKIKGRLPVSWDLPAAANALS